MALTTLTIPDSTFLTTLDTVKDELGITDDSQDDVLYRILQRASSAICRECGRPFFGIGQYQETLKGTNSQLLSLTCTPILSVTQVVVGTTQDEDPYVQDPNDPTQGYSIEDAEAGALFRSCGWGQTVSLLSWGWEAYSSRYILPGGTNTLRYTVTYTAGYQLPLDADLIPYDPTAGVEFDPSNPPATPAIPPVLNTPWTAADTMPLPGDVEQACLVTVKAWYFQRQRDMTISQARTADQSETYDLAASSKALPTAALGLIRDYRRVL